MKIIAIDSSGLVATVAIIDEKQIIAEYTLNYGLTHSQTLMPMLEELSRKIQLDFKEITGIAVAEGPGSFTGLRIGSATAKGLAMTWNVPIIPVSTLEGLAYNLYGAKDLICPIMDARRNQVYTAVYRFVEKRTETKEYTYETEVIMEPCAIAMADLIEQLNKRNEKIVFLGDGVPVQETLIRLTMQTEFCFAPSGLNRQRAAAIAASGLDKLKKGIVQSSDAHEPIYLRLSQAERERNEQNNIV